MKEKDIHTELASIRSLMERSAKFISLSGLAGVAAGFYALIGAFAGYRVVCQSFDCFPIAAANVNDPSVYQPLFIIAILILVFSVGTCILLTLRKAKQRVENAWNPVSKRLLTSVAIPLFTGALLISMLIGRGNYDLVIPACLIFYGFALFSAGSYTFNDVKWLGICEIGLGLLAVLVPGYGFLCWIVGFGILHIIYGSVMHFKYER